MEELQINTQEDYDYHRIAKAIQFVQEHFKEQPSLEEIAEKVHLSPYHFQRIFTTWAGISPKKYLQFVSANFAKNLMKGGSFSLENVAHETGLSGTSRLHDLFINIEAMTPGEYKEGGKGKTISYGFYMTPFGEVLMANTEKGICKLSFVPIQRTEDDKDILLRHSSVAELKKEWPHANFHEDSGEYELLVRRIFSDQLFQEHKGEKIKLNVRGTPFQLKVWEALLKIPFGEIASYNQVAELIGHSSASRAVGSAIGKNPVAILIPCHRVIKQSGGISGYRWDPERKLSILNWEACHLMDDDSEDNLVA